MLVSKSARGQGKVVRSRRSLMQALFENLESRLLLSGVTGIATAAISPTAIAVDNAGHEWMVDQSGLYELDSSGNQMGGPFLAGVNGLAAANVAFNPVTDHLYLADENQSAILEVDLNGNLVHTYVTPGGSSQTPFEVTAATDGSVWFGVLPGDTTVPNFTAQIGRLDLSGNMTFADIPGGGVIPTSIAAAPDGSVWFSGQPEPTADFTLSVGAEIGHARAAADGSVVIDPMYAISTPGSIPTGITVASDNSVWFGVANQGDLFAGDGPDRLVHGVLSGTSLTQTEYVIPEIGGVGGPQDVALDSSGNLWFTEVNSNQLSFMNTTTGDFTELAIPSAAANPAGLAVTSTDVWATAAGGGSDNVLQVSLAPLALPISATTPNISATVGTPYTASLATLQTLDDGPYSYSIDYGDGQTGSGTIVPDGSGTYSIPGNVTYAAAGNYNTTVEVTTADGDLVTVQGTAVVSGLVISQTTNTTVTSSAATGVYGQTIRFTAAVTNTGGAAVPTGSVQFYVDGNALGAPVGLDANGDALSLADSFASGASHAITAVYNPDANFVGSSGALTQVMQAVAVETDPTNPALVDLFVGSNGTVSSDGVQIKAAGSSKTGSTGVLVESSLDGVTTQTTYSQSVGAIYIYLQNGNNNIQLDNNLTINANIVAGNGSNNIQLGNGNDSLTLGNGNDNIQAGNGTNTLIAGNGNNNVQFGSGNNNVVILGSGNNNVQVGAGNNEAVQVGNGNNNIQIGAGGSDTVIVGTGNDNIQLGAGGSEIVTAGNGNDNIQIGAGGSDIVTVGNGNDNIQIGAGSFDTVAIGTGHDNIQIGRGSDNTVILPGAANLRDNIRFGAGSNDIIT